MTTRLIATIIAAATVAALSACDGGIFRSPGGIRMDGDTVLFAVCDEITGSELRVFTVPKSGDDVRYMYASGDVRLVPGMPVSSAAVPAGLEASIWKTPLVEPGDIVGFMVFAESGDSEYANRYVVPSTGLSEELWTRSDGTQARTPCA